MDASDLDIEWYVHRHRDENEVLPWDHIHAGLHKDFLWQDWQDALGGTASKIADGHPATTAVPALNMGSNTLSCRQLHPMVEAKARDKT